MPVPQDPVQMEKQADTEILHELRASAKSYGTRAQLPVLVSIWMGRSPFEALA